MNNPRGAVILRSYRSKHLSGIGWTEVVKILHCALHFVQNDIIAMNWMTFAQQLVLSMVFIGAPLAAPAQEGEQIIHGHKGDQSYAFRMLPPSSFTELPAPILRDLERRRCLIPQTYEARTPENVIRGAFHNKGAADWAVLCSQNGTSTLLVFWDSSVKPAELAAQVNTDAADPHDETSVLGYARGIDAASPNSMNEVIANKQYGPFDHDGIKDAHIEKSSVIHYFKNGTWMTLQGNE
jgi:hypothetical protein